MSRIILRNTLIPVKKSKSFTTSSKDPGVILVYEGDSQIAKENHFLGRFDIPAAEKVGEEREIEVIFDINFSGILHVRVLQGSVNIKTNPVGYYEVFGVVFWLCVFWGFSKFRGN